MNASGSEAPWEGLWSKQWLRRGRQDVPEPPYDGSGTLATACAVGLRKPAGSFAIVTYLRYS